QGPINPCNCGVQSPFTPSAPCPPSQVTKAWGGRTYSSFHRRLGTPPNHTDFLWAGEDGGRISLSTDEGVTWTNQPVPRGVKGEVRGMYFLDDALTGWAVTSDGWVLSTIDGGGCWQQLSYLTYCDEGAELFDVYFFGPLRGFLGGGHVLKSTIDGGVTWTNEPVDNAYPLCVINTDAEVYAFDVAGGLVDYMAVAATEPGQILYRTEAMSEWEIVLPLLPGPCPGPLAHSIESWDIDIAPGGTPSDGVAYVAMGQGNPCGAIFRLEYHHSGGSPVWTWTQEFHECPSPPPAPCRVTTPTTTDVIDCSITGAGNGLFEALYSMYAVDQNVAITVGYGAGIFRRDPATATWREISDRQYFSTAPLGTVVGNGAGKAWLFGEFGDARVLDLNAPFLFQADNPILPIPPPRPFSPLAPQTGWRLGELWFSSATTGWGAGQLGRIVRWDDAHSTWVHVRSACLSDTFSTGTLTSIVFGSLRNG